MRRRPRQRFLYRRATCSLFRGRPLTPSAPQHRCNRHPRTCTGAASSLFSAGVIAGSGSTCSPSRVSRRSDFYSRPPSQGAWKAVTTPVRSGNRSVAVRRSMRSINGAAVSVCTGSDWIVQVESHPLGTTTACGGPQATIRNSGTSSLIETLRRRTGGLLPRSIRRTLLGRRCSSWGCRSQRIINPPFAATGQERDRIPLKQPARHAKRVVACHASPPQPSCRLHTAARSDRRIKGSARWARVRC